jgi:hypothetical protein
MSVRSSPVLAHLLAIKFANTNFNVRAVSRIFVKAPLLPNSAGAGCAPFLPATHLRYLTHFVEKVKLLLAAGSRYAAFGGLSPVNRGCHLVQQDTVQEMVVVRSALTPVFGFYH